MANRGRTLDVQAFSMKDLERLGSAKLPIAYREYYNEGAMDLITLRDNENAYDRYKIRPRVLRNVSNLDPTTKVFGTTVAFPLALSPLAMQGLAHPDGEIATSRAAAAMNIPMGLSTYATSNLEDVIAQGSGNPYAMQLSLLKNKDAMARMIQRAEKAGYKALLVTLDCARLGRRLNEYRNAFVLPRGLEFPNMFPGVDVTTMADGDDRMAYDDSIEWADMMKFLRETTKMQIWAKGIYTSDDVDLAIHHGIDGIIISNHGGRQLDSVPATLDTLRDVAGVAKGRIPIGIDGGIRRGTDVFKALALGADFVLAGRPLIWGLAYAGESGVKLALDMIYDEFLIAMALAGCRTVTEITKEHLSLLEPNGILAKL